MQLRFSGVKRLSALLSLSVILACGAASEEEGTKAPAPSDETMSATVPGNEANGSDSEGASNPQRHPEIMRRPESMESDDMLVPTAPPESGGTTPAEPAPQAPPASPTTPPATPAPATPAPATPTLPPPVKVPFRGVNLAGAEFGSALPGAFGKDYTFPTNSEVDYFMQKGMNTFRVGFKWERIQTSANAALDATYLAKLDAIVSYATSKGARVILNPHNFARYYGSTVGSSVVPNGVFADLWSRLAKHFGGNALVMFNLVNEPHDMGTEQWVGAANAAIAAIRTAGATNTIIVPGNGWTGAHQWSKSNSYGTPNSVAMLKIVDPGNNSLFEVHQYMDADSSGGSGTCVSTTVGAERLVAFVDWLRANGKKGFLGELAGGNNPTCNTAVKNMLDYVHANDDVFVGWTWWAGGPWWSDYIFALDPKNGADRPQMAWLAPFLAK